MPKTKELSDKRASFRLSFKQAQYIEKLEEQGLDPSDVYRLALDEHMTKQGVGDDIEFAQINPIVEKTEVERVKQQRLEALTNAMREMSDEDALMWICGFQVPLREDENIETWRKIQSRIRPVLNKSEIKIHERIEGLRLAVEVFRAIQLKEINKLRGDALTLANMFMAKGVPEHVLKVLSRKEKHKVPLLKYQIQITSFGKKTVAITIGDDVFFLPLYRRG
jgi:hypothetical protein